MVYLQITLKIAPANRPAAAGVYQRYKAPFLTTIAGHFWQRSPRTTGASVDPNEWFTVRLAKWIFNLAPSHRGIVVVSEVLILLTAVGGLLSLRATAALHCPTRGRSASDRKSPHSSKQ